MVLLLMWFGIGAVGGGIGLWWSRLRWGEVAGWDFFPAIITVLLGPCGFVGMLIGMLLTCGLSDRTRW